ncbi:MAG: VOC family protein, partial [Pseudomonadota bacterium]
GVDLGFGSGGVVPLLLTQGAATLPRMHLCFAARNKEAVEKGYAGAVAAGGTCNGEPGYRPQYSPGYYAAFILDHDGHNVEVLFREPQG